MRPPRSDIRGEVQTYDLVQYWVVHYFPQYTSTVGFLLDILSTARCGAPPPSAPLPSLAARDPTPSPSAADEAAARSFRRLRGVRDIAFRARRARHWRAAHVLEAPCTGASA